MSGPRHIEVPSAVVLRAVARPGVLLFAARDLTFMAGGAAILTASLAADPILVIYCFLPFQAAAIWQTSRDRFLRLHPFRNSVQHSQNRQETRALAKNV